MLIDPVTRQSASLPIKVGLPGDVGCRGHTRRRVAYIDTWGHTGPRVVGDDGDHPARLAFRPAWPGSRGARSGEPVAVVGYWPGTDVRYVTYPDSRGDLWEGTPDSSASRLVSTGIRDTQRAQKRADRRHGPDRAVPDRPSELRRARSIKTVNVTGHVGRAIQLPPSLSPFFSVQFP